MNGEIERVAAEMPENSTWDMKVKQQALLALASQRVAAPRLLSNVVKAVLQGVETGEVHYVDGTAEVLWVCAVMSTSDSSARLLAQVTKDRLSTQGVGKSDPGQLCLALWAVAEIGRGGLHSAGTQIASEIAARILAERWSASHVAGLMWAFCRVGAPREADKLLRAAAVETIGREGLEQLSATEVGNLSTCLTRFAYPSENESSTAAQLALLAAERFAYLIKPGEQLRPELSPAPEIARVLQGAAMNGCWLSDALWKRLLSTVIYSDLRAWKVHLQLGMPGTSGDAMSRALQAAGRRCKSSVVRWFCTKIWDDLKKRGVRSWTDDSISRGTIAASVAYSWIVEAHRYPRDDILLVASCLREEAASRGWEAYFPEPRHSVESRQFRPPPDHTNSNMPAGPQRPSSYRRARTKPPELKKRGMSMNDTRTDYNPESRFLYLIN
eukprot:Hpha_TRINITY_DN420_c0_g1::TRINITY_DN420_c0_g1_i2::g.27560::m.27560